MQLCDAGSNVNGLDPRGRPLIAAARNGSKMIVEVLLDKGADSNLQDQDRQLPIYWAARAGNLELFELFRDILKPEGPDNTSGLSALLKVIKAGDENRAIVGADVKAKDHDGWTALHLAANIDHCNAIIALVKAGSDVGALNLEGQSPLLLAAKNGKATSIEALLGFKPDLDTRDTISGRSAVSYAAENGYAEVATLLIEAGCDIYSKGEETYSPLQHAALSGDTKLLRAFFEPKSDGVVPSKKLFRAKAIAEALRHACDAENQEYSDYQETRRFILGERRYLMSTDEFGKTVLSWAAESGSEDVVKLLLEKDVTSDSMDMTGRTPLSWAAGSGSEEAVQLLLENGADPGSKDNNSRTPLSWAAESGSLAIVKELLSRMATYESAARGREQTVDSKSKDKNWTPLWYAAHGGHVKVAKALLENDASPSANDNEGRSLIKALATVETSPISDESSINVIGRRDVRKALEPLFSLIPESLKGSENVDKSFSAIVLQFPKSSDGELRPRQKTVRELLTSPVGNAQSRDSCLKWLHLPANNMRWVELTNVRY
ncbi:ankyrin repeat-containing domain protein [Nemania serpens]|nr:ankyrin repeat-containing domain protein [Nemania serpens]